MQNASHLQPPARILLSQHNCLFTSVGSLYYADFKQTFLTDPSGYVTFATLPATY